MTNDKAIRDAIVLIEGLSEPDLLRVAEILRGWYSDDLRDLTVNLAHIAALAADHISI
jgi:hypothetical protein